MLLGAAAPGRAGIALGSLQSLKDVKSVSGSMPQPKNTLLHSFMTNSNKTKQINKTIKSTVRKMIPAAKHSVVKTVRAKPKLTKDGVMYKHREYVGEITSTTGFTNAFSLLINPGNALMFPWLSTVAKSFEKYKIHKLHFEYMHQAGTQTSGVVGGYVEYDPADAAPANLGSLLNNYDSVSGAPYDDFKILYRPREESMKNYFIDPTQDNEDYKAVNHPGQIRLFTQNATSAVLCGLLWVDYEIELLIPDTKGIPADSSIMGFYGPTFSNDDDMDNVHDAFQVIKTPDEVGAQAHALVERGPLTIRDDFGNRARIHILPMGSYNDLFSGLNVANSVCLYFDRPGKYKIDFNYRASHHAVHSSLIDTVEFAYNNTQFGYSSVRTMSEQGSTARTMYISLLLVVTDIAARFAWRYRYVAYPEITRKIAGLGFCITDIADEILCATLLKVNNVLSNGVNPFRERKTKSEGQVVTCRVEVHEPSDQNLIEYGNQFPLETANSPVVRQVFSRR